MTDQARLDQLSVNTIRTLSMDAVQAANSGHPGTPMALAPVAYCLWQRFLRFDPGRSDLAQPRPLRALGRPRLDAALLAAAPDRRQGGQPEVRARSASSSVTLDDIKHFRQLDSKCPGHPEYRWTSRRRDDDRPARPGRGHQRRHGDRRHAGWPRTSTGPASSCSTTTSTPSCGDGCMMEGISSEAASLAGHLKLVQPLLDLRQQQDHHRGPHRPGLQRGRRHALHRLRLERHARRRRQRPARCSTAPSHVFKKHARTGRR